MQTQEIFKLMIDANKDAYETSWKAVSDFQEKSEEAMKSALDSSLLPREAKDAAAKSIDIYNQIVKQLLDASKAGYDNLVKTMMESQEKSEQLAKEFFGKSLLPEEAKKAFFAPLDLYKENYTQTQKPAKKKPAKTKENVEA